MTLLESFRRGLRYKREQEHFNDLPMLQCRPAPTPSGHPDNWLVEDERKWREDWAAITRAGRKLWAAAQFENIAVPEHEMSLDYEIAESYPVLVACANWLDADVVQVLLDEWRGR